MSLAIHRSTAVRTMTLALVLSLGAGAATAQDVPPRLADAHLRHADFNARDRPAPRAETAPAPEPPPPPPPASDPYGFAAILNGYRAAAGLPPLAYDVELSSWAGHNNAAQCGLGLGHHVNPSCYQNSGWNYPDASSAAVGWMNSPGHRANLLVPGASRFGIAYGPGPYWTLNVR